MSPADRALSECRIAHRKLAAENAKLRALIRLTAEIVILIEHKGVQFLSDADGYYDEQLTPEQTALWRSIVDGDS